MKLTHSSFLFIGLFLLLPLACTSEADGGPPPTSQAPAAITTAACGVTLDEVSLYQGVEVVLGRRDVATPVHELPVIAGRPALVRAFVTPPAGGVELSAHLRIVSPTGTHEDRSTRTLAGPSTRGDLASTVNFQVPADALAVGASLSLELSSPSCPGQIAARFPTTGETPLQPLDTGTLTVSLVPIRYDTDGSGRLPDTSPAQLERFRAQLMAMFPIAAVDLQVHAPVSTKIAVTAQGGWASLLETVRDLRAREAPPANVYYYGLVMPEGSPGAYCLGACIGGISYVTGAGDVGLRAGVGVGFAGLATAESMAHELGHLHGRPHAPCGAVGAPDRGYPYADAAIGGWGLDARGAGTLEPPDTKDLMSYCSPRWISDYTFQAIARRAAQIDVAPAVAQALESGASTRWRVLLVDAAGRASWGMTATGAPPGTQLTARRLDAAGAHDLSIWQAPLADGDERVYWVPASELAPGDSVQIDGAAPLVVPATPDLPPLAP